MTLIKFVVDGSLPLGKFGNYLFTCTVVLFLQSVKDHLYLTSYVKDLSSFALLLSTTLVQLLANSCI